MPRIASSSRNRTTTSTPSFHRRRFTHFLHPPQPFIPIFRRVYSLFYRCNLAFPSLSWRFFSLPPLLVSIRRIEASTRRLFLIPSRHTPCNMTRERNRFEEEGDRISLPGISRSCSLEASNNRTTEVSSPLPTPFFPSSPILYVRLKFAR